MAVPSGDGSPAVSAAAWVVGPSPSPRPSLEALPHAGASGVDSAAVTVVVTAGASVVVVVVDSAAGEEADLAATGLVAHETTSAAGGVGAMVEVEASGERPKTHSIVLHGTNRSVSGADAVEALDTKAGAASVDPTMDLTTTAEGLQVVTGLEDMAVPEVPADLVVMGLREVDLVGMARPAAGLAAVEAAIGTSSAKVLGGTTTATPSVRATRPPSLVFLPSFSRPRHRRRLLSQCSRGCGGVCFPVLRRLCSAFAPPLA